MIPLLFHFSCLKVLSLNVHDSGHFLPIQTVKFCLYVLTAKIVAWRKQKLFFNDQHD